LNNNQDYLCSINGKTGSVNATDGQIWCLPALSSHGRNLCNNILYFPHGLDIIIDKITAFLKISSSFQVDSKGFSVSDLSTRNPKRTGVKGFLTKNST